MLVFKLAGSIQAYLLNPTYLGFEVTREKKVEIFYFIMVPLRKKVLKYVLQSPVTVV